MKYFAVDQFGVDVPDITAALNQNREAFEGVRTGVNGKCQWYALDNPLAGETSEEAATLLHVSVRTVVDMCLRGALSAYRYPARWRIPICELEHACAEVSE